MITVKEVIIFLLIFAIIVFLALAYWKYLRKPAEYIWVGDGKNPFKK